MEINGGETMSVIFVDSACDLNATQLKKLGLGLVAFNTKLDGKQVGKSDEKYINACKNYDKLQLDITKDDFIKAFKPYLDNGENIMYVCTNQNTLNITTPFSDAVKTLNELYPTKEIKIYNLESTSTIAGVIVYEVGLMYKRGCTDLEITNFMDEFKTMARGYIVTNNNAFLNTCENKENFNLKALPSICTIVEYICGRCEIVDYVNGRKKALTQIIGLMENNSINIADYTIQVGCALQESSANYFKEQLEKKFNNECTVFIQKLSLDNVMMYNGDAIVVGYHGKKKQ